MDSIISEKTQAVIAILLFMVTRSDADTSVELSLEVDNIVCVDHGRQRGIAATYCCYSCY